MSLSRCSEQLLWLWLSVTCRILCHHTHSRWLRVCHAWVNNYYCSLTTYSLLMTSYLQVYSATSLSLSYILFVQNVHHNDWHIESCGTEEPATGYISTLIVALYRPITSFWIWSVIVMLMLTIFIAQFLKSIFTCLLCLGFIFYLVNWWLLWKGNSLIDQSIDQLTAPNWLCDLRTYLFIYFYLFFLFYIL